MRISIGTLQAALPNRVNNLGQVIDREGALNRFLTALSAPNVPAVLKFRMARIVKQIKAEMETFQSAQDELIEKYGARPATKEDEGKVIAGGLVWPDVETKERADKEYAEMLSEEVEIKFDTFSEQSIEGLNVSIPDLLTLDWLFGGLEKSELKAVEAA